MLTARLHANKFSKILVARFENTVCHKIAL